MSPPLLPPLPEGPLALSAARRLGLTDPQWRLDELLRVTQSVRALEDPATVAARAAAFALALPDDVVFSHVTAAQLWRLPLPASLEAQRVLDVMRDTKRHPIERRGCRHHRGAEQRLAVMTRGVRMTSLADTWVDLGSLAGRGLTLDDIVVAGDVVLNRLTKVDDDEPDRPASASLAEVLDRRVRVVGRSALCSAMDLCRRGSRSPMESRSRLMVVRAGLPEPELNAGIHDTDGAWLAEGDLVWRRRQVVAEYQGAVHADRRARALDAYRIGLLTDAGWTVVELFHEDVTQRHRSALVIRRLATALEIDARDLTLP
ncbi:hypothetical protein [Oryzobacter telluris]|uniref:hypothetical protein n=1 Tax=Oryzobacter telluris TaxID=3149179 RepID=UPI00370D9ECE